MSGYPDKANVDDIKTAGKALAITIPASFIPGIGPLADQILELCIRSPLQARQKKFIDDLSAKIDCLQLDVNELKDNERFSTALVQIFPIVLQTQSEYKKNCLMTAAINVATGVDIDESKMSLFIQLVGRFSEWHVKFLVQINSINFIDATSESHHLTIFEYLSNYYLELSNEQDFCHSILLELCQTRLLHNTNDNWSLGPHIEPATSFSITKLGKEFLNFCLQPQQ